MADDGTSSDGLRDRGAVAFSVMLLLVVIVIGYFLFHNLGVAPVLGQDGKTVLTDEYGRVKDLWTGILPLITVAGGFWFGARGTAQAQKNTAQAQQLAAQRKEQLDDIAKKHPQVFGGGN